MKPQLKILATEKVGALGQLDWGAWLRVSGIFGQQVARFAPWGFHQEVSRLRAVVLEGFWLSTLLGRISQKRKKLPV